MTGHDALRVLVNRTALGPGTPVQPEQTARPVPLNDRRLAELYAAPVLPWLRANMVSTLDGAATGADGRSGSINDAVDRRVFRLLRQQADVIVVGAGTADVEGYRPTRRPIVLVSRHARVPPLLRDAPSGSVLVATCLAADQLGAARSLLGEDQVLVCGEHRVDLHDLRARLTERGHRSVLCEGGPRMLRDLLAAGVVDELCVTVVPRLLAGDHTRITAGLPVDVPLDLRLLLEQDGTLLARWFIRH